MMKELFKERALWYIFCLEFFLVGVTAVGTVFHWHFVHGTLFKIVIPATVPILLLIVHAHKMLGLMRGLFLVLLGGTVGLYFETVGLRYGTFFGGHYVYNTTMPLIYGVPFLVVLYWSLFIYTGYAITTSFLVWLKKEKPSRHNRKLFLLAGLILADGLIVTAIDLFMDPIQVKMGAWEWLQGGPYYGVPIGNFFGWFVVVIIVTTLFRSFEYIFPSTQPLANKSVYAMPVISYAILAFFFAVQAITLNMYGLAVFGSLPMLVVVLSNLMVYRRLRLATDAYSL